MTRENFELALRAFYQRKPIRPFTLELSSGSRIEINHPEAIRLSREGVLFLYQSTSGIQSIIDCESVIRFIDGTGTT